MNGGMDECMYVRMDRWEWVANAVVVVGGGQALSKGCPYTGFLVVVGRVASHQCSSRSMTQ